MKLLKPDPEIEALARQVGGPEKLPWYNAKLDKVAGPMGELLQEYGRIPPGEMLQHVQTIRDVAFQVYPYPCFGAFLFLDLYLPQCPFYAEIVERVKGGDILLDLGCGLGQELRQLAYDGCPPENLYASDLYAEFGSIGCDLFRDAPIFAAQFLAADVFDESSPLAQRLQGRTDIINATFFFHMWDWEKQVLAAKRIVALLRPRTGSLVVGRHAGHRSPGTSAPGRGTKGGKTRFLHNEETWRELWDRVSLETESRWSVDAWVEEWRAEDPVTRQFKEDGCVVLNFAARRLE